MTEELNSKAEKQTDFDVASFQKTLPTHPGVYRMLDSDGKILYVGKARNLKKRVLSYFRSSGLPPKTVTLMKQMVSMEVTVTNTEAEALLLESNLIKAHMPRYNILLRDDKSYPYIYLSDKDEYPQLAVHRGARKKPGRYFGPYPNVGAVRESLNLLQQIFRVRQCEDSYFRNRSRPCLQYQIERCRAPCVGFISAKKYQQDVQDTVMFLEGKSNHLAESLATRMEQAADKQHYEEATVYRDQIASLQKIQQRQYISGESGDVDILAAVVNGGVACVQVFFIRNGHNLGNRVYFPRLPAAAAAEEVLSAFIGQFYLNNKVPSELLVNLELAERTLLMEVLALRAERGVTISHRLKGTRARWLSMCVNNAEQALAARLNSRLGMQQRLVLLQEILGLEEIPKRLEGFDISHTQGENTVASCVVFDNEGPRKQDYRKFSISGITPGDDYAAMEQALRRRYTRLQKEAAPLPEILLIDGGKGQVSVAVKVLESLQIKGVLIVGVAKGPERRPGLELLHIPSRNQVFELPADSPALHLIQQVRDESHRFAVAGHRARRAKVRNHSPLEQIAGIGQKRRQQLLKYFGGLKEITSAGVDDLARVKGISKQLAQQIYDVFHE
ncbi:MAG: excinuclease ABC subunit UvrC [Gammaproteobacteria bacterium]